MYKQYFMISDTTNFIFLFLILFGLYNFTYFYVEKLKVSIFSTLGNNISKNEKKIFLHFLVILIIFSYVGIINNLSFWASKNIFFALKIIIIISILGYILKAKNKIDYNFFKFSLPEYKKNKFLYSFLIINIFIIFNRLHIEWAGQDEIAYYGYTTRLYAEGWVIKDGIYPFFTKFSEIFFSFFYLVTNNLILAKYFKFLIFLSVLFFFYICVKILCKDKYTAIISTLILLTIPEFSYVGAFSMKVDNILFCFELVSIIFITILFNDVINNDEKNKKNYYLLIFFSFFFSSIAFVIKVTGIYLLIFNLLVFFYFLLKKKTFKNISNIFLVNSLLFFSTVSPFFLYNLVNYNNPIYPTINKIWLKFYEDSIYIDYFIIDNLKAMWNLPIKTPFIGEIYALIYNSLGMSKQIFPFFKNIIHPNEFVATGWWSPIVLIILVVPFLLKKNKLIIFLLYFFIFQYICWYNGVQYNRVFIASSCIPLIIYSLIFVSLKKEKNSILYKIFSNLNIMLILFFTIYHFTISVRANPYMFNILNNANTYEDNLIKSLDRKNWDKYIKRNFQYSSDKKLQRKEIHNNSNILFNHEDMLIMNNFLIKKNKILILNQLSYHPYIHTLINKGYVVQIFDKNSINFYINSSISYENLCVFSNNDFFENENFKLIHKNKNNLTFKCLKLKNTF
jgi:hypothetical protein